MHGDRAAFSRRPGITNFNSYWGRHAELRPDDDLDVNVKAEREIEVVLQDLELSKRTAARDDEVTKRGPRRTDPQAPLP